MRGGALVIAMVGLGFSVSLGFKTQANITH